MTNLEKIKQKLMYPSGYALIPQSHKDVPLPFPEWEIQDADGKGTGNYYSPQTLSDEVGNLLVLEPRINGEWFIMRYGLDWDTVNQVSQYLTSIGLIDIRRNDDDTLKPTDEIDFGVFGGLEFMIIPVHQAVNIPYSKPEQES